MNKRGKKTSRKKLRKKNRFILSHTKASHKSSFENLSTVEKQTTTKKRLFNKFILKLQLVFFVREIRE
jgi:hypothetical protein